MESKLSRQAISSSSFASCHYLMSFHHHRLFAAVYQEREACICLVSRKTNQTIARRLVLVKLCVQQVQHFASTSMGRSDGTVR